MTTIAAVLASTEPAPLSDGPICAQDQDRTFSVENRSPRLAKTQYYSGHHRLAREVYSQVYVNRITLEPGCRVQLTPARGPVPADFFSRVTFSPDRIALTITDRCVSATFLTQSVVQSIEAALTEQSLLEGATVTFSAERRILQVEIDEFDQFPHAPFLVLEECVRRGLHVQELVSVERGFFITLYPNRTIDESLVASIDHLLRYA